MASPSRNSQSRRRCKEPLRYSYNPDQFHNMDIRGIPHDGVTIPRSTSDTDLVTSDSRSTLMVSSSYYSIGHSQDLVIHWDIKEEVDAGDWIGMYLIGGANSVAPMATQLPPLAAEPMLAMDMLALWYGLRCRPFHITGPWEHHPCEAKCVMPSASSDLCSSPGKHANVILFAIDEVLSENFLDYKNRGVNGSQRGQIIWKIDASSYFVERQFFLVIRYKFIFESTRKKEVFESPKVTSPSQPSALHRPDHMWGKAGLDSGRSLPEGMHRGGEERDKEGHACSMVAIPPYTDPVHGNLVSVISPEWDRSLNVESGKVFPEFRDLFQDRVYKRGYLPKSEGEGKPELDGRSGRH
ncbi:E3 ubiquitin-protein ligase HECW1 [Fukomys damarensis]|uniref:E3 ubiquitin-protein ligase HECW1 n=1 Tax=Fukomys damarensis TaxID=885580 RepID=A0A091CSZ5_FUKDA|nr:E3 ubiquitin-protein ligase HECW1 [Fukomys damarensis]